MGVTALLLVATAGQALAAQVTLVAAGSRWRYLDDGSDQGTAWAQPTFDDSRWTPGRAELGYGDGDEAKVVRYGPNADHKYITTYFRHALNVSETANYTKVLLAILCDDGAVVYLNGVEVFRTNMPTGPITYTTLALRTMDGPDEKKFTETTIDANSLTTGPNILAVEIHQDSDASPDLSFDLTLTGVTKDVAPVGPGGPGGPGGPRGPGGQVVPGVNTDIKGPYLFYPGDPTKMQVLWQLLTPKSHPLHWGRDTTYAEGSITPSLYGDNQYEHTITGLTPGAKYYYQVEGLGSGSFRAAPPANASNVKFLVFGDTQGDPNTQDRVNKAMIDAYTSDPNYQTFTLRVGDWTSNGDTESAWTNECFSRARPHILEIQANLPFNGCVGTHEGSGTLFQKYWPFPWEKGGQYWSFDYGPAHFVLLNLVMEGTALDDAQRKWLEADLAASTKPWKFLLFHAPTHSAYGLHPNNMMEQAYIQTLCEIYGVAIVFTGHNHSYAHGEVEGITYVTTGGGGAPLYPVDLSYDPSIVKAVSTYHFCKVDIHGAQLDFEAVGIDGAVIDAFTLHRPPMK